MTGRLFKVSPSRLNAFTTCPRLYHLRYLARPRPAAAAQPAHQALGDSVHIALARWWDLPPARRSFGEAGNLLNEHWIDAGYRNPKHAEVWRTRARGWVRSYAATLYGRPVPLGVERTVSAPDGDLILEGRVDRLDDRDGHLVVVDYKAGRETPTDATAAASVALAVYAVATGRMMRRRCARVELHHIPTGTVAAAVHDTASIGRHLERVRAVADDIRAATDTLGSGAHQDEVFPPSPSALCRSCAHRGVCPEGQQVGPAAEPWVALDRWATELAGAVA